MNKLLEAVYKSRGGHYCHAVEVNNYLELMMIADAIYSENRAEYDKETIIDFLETLSVYSLSDNDNDTESIYNFSFRDYVETLI